MPGRASSRYKMDENGTMRSAFHGKLPEEFTERDMLAFAADTDLLLFQKVSEETLAAIHAAGYDYQDGAVIPRPGKEETDMAEQETKAPAQDETQTAPPMKLGVSVRAIQPMGNLLGFASVKLNDCFVVEDFKILQTDKGLYVGMPASPTRPAEPATGTRQSPLPGISGNSSRAPSLKATRRSWGVSGRWQPHRNGLPSRASWRLGQRRRRKKTPSAPRRRRKPRKPRNAKNGFWSIWPEAERRFLWPMCRCLTI